MLIIMYSGSKQMMSIANPKSLPASGGPRRCRVHHGSAYCGAISHDFSHPATLQPRPIGANLGQPHPIPDKTRHIPDTASCVVRDQPPLSGIVRPFQNSRKSPPGHSTPPVEHSAAASSNPRAVPPCPCYSANPGNPLTYLK